MVYFAQTGGLATQSADVEELGATNLVAANLFDLVDDFGIEGEDALYALSEAHLADRECPLRAVIDGDHQAFKCLQAFLVAFLDLYLDANLVAGHKRRQIGALKLVGQALHYWMYGHGIFLLLDSELPVYQRTGPSANPDPMGLVCRLDQSVGRLEGKAEGGDGMKSRIVLWALMGALVAALWSVYISQTMQNLKNPDSFSGVLIRITCPIALANHHAISLYQVLLANAATYAIAGAVVEILRRRSRLQSIPN